MPYIEKERRDILDPLLEPIIYQIECDGEVNYCITRIIDNLYSNKNYEAFERGIGVLECVKQEFYRRRIAPFEDVKKEERGDVYG